MVVLVVLVLVVDVFPSYVLGTLLLSEPTGVLIQKRCMEWMCFPSYVLGTLHVLWSCHVPVLVLVVVVLGMDVLPPKMLGTLLLCRYYWSHGAEC